MKDKNLRSLKSFISRPKTKYSVGLQRSVKMQNGRMEFFFLLPTLNELILLMINKVATSMLFTLRILAAISWQQNTINIVISALLADIVACLKRPLILVKHLKGFQLIAQLYMTCIYTGAIRKETFYSFCLLGSGCSSKSKWILRNYCSRQTWSGTFFCCGILLSARAIQWATGQCILFKPQAKKVWWQWTILAKLFNFNTGSLNYSTSLPWCDRIAQYGR